MFAAAGLVAALFFLRFWRSTRDRLFLIFAVSFVLMAVTRLVLAINGPGNIHNEYAYSIRFLAYLLILVAIVDKNRPRVRRAREPAPQ